MSEFEVFYRAMASRDQRFDGHFVVAVTSTRVYCRPSCPSRTPLRVNCRFFRLPAAAEAAGFRACRRCRPHTEPSSPEWNVRGDLVGRALRLIASGAGDDGGVAGVARRLAVSERHLHRQLVTVVGVGPQTLIISRRARTARMLIESTALPLADVAFAAGYASVRQFNEGMRAAFGCPPSELRRTRPKRSTDAGELVLRLRYRPPLAGRSLVQWLAARALGGVEVVANGRYCRTLRLPHGPGYVAAEFDSAHDGQAALTVRLALADLRDVAAAVARCREIFDLDADPVTIGDDFESDAVVGPLVRARPGLRVPGCADGFELAVRAVLGQQVSLAAARTFGTRLASSFGEPLTTVATPDLAQPYLFPTPDALAAADLVSIGLTKRRAATIRALAEAVCTSELVLDRGTDRADCVAAMLTLPGVGPWTAGYVAMRALGDPDVFLPTDLGLLEAARLSGVADSPRTLEDRARRWRPWRSYAAMHLWASLPPRAPRTARGVQEPVSA